MIDAFAKVVAQADAEGEYLRDSQLEALRVMVADGNKRLDVINRITNNAPKIVIETIRAWLLEFPQLVVTDNIYLDYQFGSCLGDMDLILRYITYAIFSGDSKILEDLCLNEVRERWLSVKENCISITATVQIMKLIAINIVSDPNNITTGDCSSIIAELAGYFDYVTNLLGNEYSGESANRAIQNLQELRAREDETNFRKANKNYDWKPSNYTEWVERDSLIQVLLKYEVVEDLLLFEESALRFFQSWNQASSQDKEDIWREREIMAALYERMMQHWKKLPDFRSVAVANRVVDGRNRLTGILVFNFAIGNEYYKLWNIPQYLRIKSCITSLSEEEELIPIQLEWMSKNTEFSKEVSVSTSVSTPLATLLSVQSGDKITGCCNIDGRLDTGKSVTLTTFVIPQNSSDVSDVRLLTVGHGFKMGYTDIYTCELQSSRKIGEVSYDKIIHEDYAKDLDVSLIKPTGTLQINSYLKWVQVVPKPPIDVIKREMRVQMYGGTSKHQTGHIDYSQMLDFGPISSVVPFFTAIIKAQPGDSGALLITGHGTSGDPEEDGKKRGYSEAYLDSKRFAMLGILLEGAIHGAFQNVVTFRPIDTVFLRLKVKPYFSTM
jgi:phycocyanin beta chain